MPTTVSINFNAQQILDSRGLGKNQEAQILFTNEFYKLSQPYTPKDENILATLVDMEKDSITYKSPYARYQYYGKVMAGNPKQATDKNLTYEGSPMRGSFWDRRCWSDRGQEILQKIANKVGGEIG